MKRATMKTSRPKGVPREVKELLKQRNHGACEVGMKCLGRERGIDPAHREGKGSGGTGKSWSNLASNLLWSCRPCHDLIDNVTPGGAERLGFKVRSGVARPWEVPVKHYEHGWVLLDDVGGHRPAPRESFDGPGRHLTPVVACTSWELIQQNGSFAEAMDRYGHRQCPGWSAPRVGLFTCGCGSSPFVLIEAPS